MSKSRWRIVYKRQKMADKKSMIAAGGKQESEDCTLKPRCRLINEQSKMMDNLLYKTSKMADSWKEKQDGGQFTRTARWWKIYTTSKMAEIWQRKQDCGRGKARWRTADKTLEDNWQEQQDGGQSTKQARWRKVYKKSKLADNSQGTEDDVQLIKKSKKAEQLTRKTRWRHWVAGGKARRRTVDGGSWGAWLHTETMEVLFQKRGNRKL
jgi:hypothetical protein